MLIINLKSLASVYMLNKYTQVCEGQKQMEISKFFPSPIRFKSMRVVSSKNCTTIISHFDIQWLNKIFLRKGVFVSRLKSPFFFFFFWRLDLKKGLMRYKINKCFS
jgi:hypothetical protein